MTNMQIEDLAYDLICFLKRWGLWEKIEIHCFSTHRAFCDAVPDFRSSTSLSAGRMGFRDLEDIYVAAINYDWQDYLDPLAHDEEKPVLVLYCGCGQFDELLCERNPTIRLSQLSCTLREYVIEHAIEESDLLSWLRCELDEHPILDDTEFDSYDEYLELEQEMEDELMDAGEKCSCGAKVADRIIREFEALLDRHHVFWSCPYAWSAPELRFYDMICGKMMT